MLNVPIVRLNIADEWFIILTMNSIMKSLKQFEAIEANLAKAERLWKDLRSLFPSGFDLTNDYSN